MKYEPMNECHTNFASSYICECQMYFQCTILMCETYELTNFAWFSLLNHEMLSLWCRCGRMKLNAFKWIPILKVGVF
jgi:hypothetical protein